jgi:nitroreductase
MYDKLKSISESPPTDNEKYNIFQFFAHDPEGRVLEFQHFHNRVDSFRSGDSLLRTRRSIRDYSSDPVATGVLEKVLDLSRFAPSSFNAQPFYFKIIKDAAMIAWLGGCKEEASSPIGRAPMAVAICCDTSLTSMPSVDGAIAVHQFMLAAWFCGLGSCWIGGLDRDDVKVRLGIPREHYVATVTPVGYPATGGCSEGSRKPVSHFVRE